MSTMTMMGGFAFPQSPLSLSASPNSSATSSDASMDSSTKHHLSHSRSDGLRPSHYYHDQSSLYPPDANDDVSPRTVPLSFRNLSCHDNSATSTPISRNFGFPVLTIRKTSSVNGSSSGDGGSGSGGASLSQEPSHGSLSQVIVHGSSPKHHRRRQSTEFSFNPSHCTKLSTSRKGDRELYLPQPLSPTSKGDRCVGSNGSLYSNNNSMENMSSHNVDDPAFPGKLEMATGKAGFCSNSGGDEVCPRHHHRQSVSSTVSISCSDREDDDEPFGRGIEASIAMEPMAPSMLVPLVDRCDEMSDLLKHPANKAWTKLVQNTIGRDVYEKECIPLWTFLGRTQVPDSEWLIRSKKLLSKKGCGGICDGRLWNEFCRMVGWDSGATIPDETEIHDDPMRRESIESLISTSSGKMSSIAEVEEEYFGGLYRTPTDELQHFPRLI